MSGEFRSTIQYLLFLLLISLVLASVLYSAPPTTSTFPSLDPASGLLVFKTLVRLQMQSVLSTWQKKWLCIYLLVPKKGVKIEISFGIYNSAECNKSVVTRTL